MQSSVAKDACLRSLCSSIPCLAHHMALLQSNTGAAPDSVLCAVQTRFRKSVVTANKELSQVPWEVELTIEVRHAHLC